MFSRRKCLKEYMWNYVYTLKYNFFMSVAILDVEQWAAREEWTLQATARETTAGDNVFSPWNTNSW